MKNVLVAAIFIASTFFGSQSFSCDDNFKSVSAIQQVTDTQSQSHSDHENDGCDCPGHSHSCCNQPTPIFDSLNFAYIIKDSEAHSREPQSLVKSPILDGPYQPPKA